MKKENVVILVSLVILGVLVYTHRQENARGSTRSSPSRSPSRTSNNILPKCSNYRESCTLTPCCFGRKTTKVNGVCKCM